MDLFRALVLGIIQGLTEFLPISSSAHLIIVPWLFDWEPFGLAFDVSLHLGTLAAILIYFRDELREVVVGLIGSRNELVRGQLPADPMARLGIFIAIGTIPAALAGLFAEDAIENYFHDDPLPGEAIVVIAVVLILLGIALEVADRWVPVRYNDPTARSITFRHAIIVGLAQSLALIPGASRSGTTITAGLFAGLNRPAAARFSFLLGVPLIAGAGAKQILELTREGLGGIGLSVFVIGMLAAGVTGYFAIAGLLRFLQRRPVTVFFIYRVLLGLSLLLLLAAGFEG